MFFIWFKFVYNIERESFFNNKKIFLKKIIIHLQRKIHMIWKQNASRIAAMQKLLSGKMSHYNDSHANVDFRCRLFSVSIFLLIPPVVYYCCCCCCRLPLLFILVLFMLLFSVAIGAIFVMYWIYFHKCLHYHSIYLLINSTDEYCHPFYLYTLLNK